MVYVLVAYTGQRAPPLRSKPAAQLPVTLTALGPQGEPALLLMN